MPHSLSPDCLARLPLLVGRGIVLMEYHPRAASESDRDFLYMLHCLTWREAIEPPFIRMRYLAPVQASPQLPAL